MRNLFVLLWLTGCGENIYFSDDEGGTRHQKSASGQHDDDLSLPYALGTRLNVDVRGPVGNAAGWKLSSDAPNILAVTSKVNDDGTLHGELQALAEGDTWLRVRDGSGGEQHAALVTVRAADRARLFSHGDLRVVANDSADAFDAAEVSDIHVLAGGKAVLAVAYYRGSVRLYGRGIAETGDATVANMTSSGGATNEWLFVTPTAPGAYTVSLKQGATQLAALAVTAVPETSLAGLSLVEQMSGSRNDKDQVWVLARATDNGGREVLGVYSGWTLDGAPQKFGGDNPATQGDLYRYHFATDGTMRSLQASRGALTAQLSVRAHDGEVNDTTYLGCSASSFRGRPSLLAFVALFLLLHLMTRKRRSSSSDSDVIQAPATNERGR
jgi:hypothetical protein